MKYVGINESCILNHLLSWGSATLWSCSLQHFSVVRKICRFLGWWCNWLARSVHWERWDSDMGSNPFQPYQWSIDHLLCLMSLSIVIMFKCVLQLRIVAEQLKEYGGNSRYMYLKHISEDTKFIHYILHLRDIFITENASWWWKRHVKSIYMNMSMPKIIKNIQI